MGKKNGAGPASFEVRLKVDDSRLTIVMAFDFDLGAVAYTTTWGAGRRPGFDPPIRVRRFMTEAFVDFYVFDGELADRLLHPKHTHAETAVESLFQLNIFRDMERPIDSYWYKKTQHVGAREQRGHSRRTNLLRRWEERAEELRREKARLESDLLSANSALRDAEEQYREQLSRDKGRQEELSAAEQRVSSLHEQVSTTARTLLEEMRNPYAIAEGFAHSIFELRSALDHTKLPESAAREFFVELADEDYCVCGRPIDEVVRQKIQARADAYLTADSVSVLNAMKSQIADAVGESRSAPADALSHRVQQLASHATALKKAQNQLDIVRQNVEAPDNTLHELGQEIGKLKTKSENIEERLSVYNEKDESVRVEQPSTVDITRVFSIQTIDDGVAKLRHAVEEVTKSRGLSQKRDLLVRILELAMVKARGSITDAICSDTNDRIAKLMPYNDIRINKIDGCLRLRGQEGSSAGETLSVGYAFLSTLLGRAHQHRLPFIVDSPANPIDLAIRPKIGELVPRLTDQFVAFVISSERAGFVSSAVSGQRARTRLLTLFRKGATRYEDRAKATAGSVMTEDGIMVVDEGFFGEFQQNTE